MRGGCVAEDAASETVAVSTASVFKPEKPKWQNIAKAERVRRPAEPEHARLRSEPKRVNHYG